MCLCMYLSVSLSLVLFIFFFFFQAEDGIRDYKVTGVQTCALPICDAVVVGVAGDHAGVPEVGGRRERQRSEERRVGKECRSRGGPEHVTKKEQGAREEGMK